MRSVTDEALLLLEQAGDLPRHERNRFRKLSDLVLPGRGQRDIEASLRYLSGRNGEARDAVFARPANGSLEFPARTDR